MNSCDKMFKNLPNLESGDKPKLEDIIYNLHGLMGYLMADEMENGVKTIWWATQLLERNTPKIKDEENEQKIKSETMCHECHSTDINYGKGYRRCNNCGTMLNTKNIIWG